MYQTVYDFATITRYPELKPYLLEKLSELGTPRVEPYHLGDSYCKVNIEFTALPRVWDWAKDNYPLNLQHINSAGGGCFIRPSIAHCFELPKPDNRFATFVFALSVDSRDYRISEHSPELVKGAIDRFVAASKNGFCYRIRNPHW